MFHRRCGDRVKLANGNKTAIRNFSDFNYGLVLSSEPLVENQLFEVRIDKKINSWSGSIEIGVTALDPETMEFPSSATDLREGSWIMSGNSILKDGLSIVDVYGTDLDKLTEGDLIGVMRTTEDELMFYVNGVCQGVAAVNLPDRLHAIVDLYGKCAQVTIVDPDLVPDSERSETDVDLGNDLATTTDLVASLNVNMNVSELASDRASSRLQFHQHCGTLVKLSAGNRTAERRRPLDEFNNAVVMTHRPLRNNELFEIRIDRLVEKWSGSIEVGITAHNPTALEFPATMTNMRSGTTMMSGCGILTNGKGTKREYGEFNLDELREGDRIGMMRKSNGNLHYFINGLDQGIAATKVVGCVWGVVDLYGMTVKVTIVDRDEREEQNLVTRRNTTMHQMLLGDGLNDCPDEDAVNRLMFHPKCGTHAAVINNARTAHRPNAMDDFNNGVVLTSRPINSNELFEVRLDRMVTKWAGSIEIGVTTHAPTKLEYPSTMTNVRSGTWMMTGNGVMHNGTTIIDEYGQNLDRLQVGDRVGVMRKESGTVHFFVNGTDQGAAATNVPDRVYGVIDLYGQAAQATILDTLDCYSPDLTSQSNTILYSDLRFHHVHGKNARVSNNGLTASRPRAFGEFNDAIVVSSRALREGEMFEISIEKMVDRWSGSIEAGVTAIRPEDLDFPGTMTDITHDTWMLSGSTVMQDGMTLRNGYSCDLDLIAAGTKIGMMRHPDGTLHFYVDGADMGAACTGVPSHVYAVIDLYGQCAQVSIVQPAHASTTRANTADQPMQLEPVHRFASWCGKLAVLSCGSTAASRVRDYSHALALSAAPLEQDEVFEVAIRERAPQWAGSLRIGVTAAEHAGNLPAGVASLPADTWFLAGNEVRKNGTTLRTNYCPSLDWLVVGSRVGVRRGADGSLSFTLNGEDMGVAAYNLPPRVFAVVDLYGSTVTVSVTSARSSGTPSEAAPAMMESSRLQDSLELLLDTTPTQTKHNDPCSESLREYLESRPWMDATPPSVAQPMACEPCEFHENRGRNVELGGDRLSARRVASYNQGLVVSAKPLLRGQLFQVRVDSLNHCWVSSIMCGVSGSNPDKASLPVTALGFKKQAWVVAGDCVFHNGVKTKGSYGPNLDLLATSHVVGVMVDSESRLHLFVNGVDQGVAAVDIPQQCYAVVDLYGRCEQVTVLNSAEDVNQAIAQASLAQSLPEPEEPLLGTESESLSEKADSECHEKEKPSRPEAFSRPSSQNQAHRIANQELHDSNSNLSQEMISSNSFNEGLKLSSVSNSPTSVSHSASLEDAAVSLNEVFIPDNESSANVDSNVSTSVISSSKVAVDSNAIYSTDNAFSNSAPDAVPTVSNSNALLNDSNIIPNANTIANLSIASKPSNEANPNTITNLSIASKASNSKACSNKPNATIKEPSTNTLANLSLVNKPSNSNFISNDTIPSPNTIANLSIANNSNLAIRGSNHNLLNQGAPSPVSLAPSAPGTPVSGAACEYQATCNRFKNMMGLPDGFFQYDPACFCDCCWKLRGADVKPVSGGGWCRFPLRRRDAAPPPDKWQAAFYAARLGDVRRILDHGQLLLPGELGLERSILGLHKDKSKEDVCDGTQLIFSPSLHFADVSLPKKDEYVDPKTQQRYVAHAAFQILVQPGSFKVSTRADEQDLVEWVTKERGATALCSLYVKLEPV